MVHSTSCLTIWGNLNETSSFDCILRDKHWRNSHTLKFSTKSLTFPCLICPWTYILLKIALKSKIVMKRKNLSRFLEPQKVAPNAKSFCTWHGSRYVTGVSYRTPPNRVPPIWRPPWLSHSSSPNRRDIIARMRRLRKMSIRIFIYISVRMSRMASFTTPHLNFSITYVSGGVEHQMES